MILWALVVGMSLSLASGQLDAGAQVEAVFKTEAECKAIKEQLDKGSKEAAEKGEVRPEINSFGATCAQVPLVIHNKKKTTGA